MVLVAIAGGTSATLGRSLVTAILATGKHEVVIVSRQPSGLNEPPGGSTYGAVIKYVDYSSQSSITSALNGVHTLISVLKILDPGHMTDTHVTLLRAAIKAEVKRFAASDWSLGPKSHDDVLASKKQLYEACKDVAVETGSDIEVCQFQNGAFLEYFAQGLPHPSEERKRDLLGGLEDDMMQEYINIVKGKLVIPLRRDGKPAEVGMASIRDIGRLVAAALDLPTGAKGWYGMVQMCGWRGTFEDVRELLKETNAPEIEKETVSMQQCDQKAEDFEKILTNSFDIGALMGKMEAQMMRSVCLEDEGAMVRGDLNEILHEAGIGIETRDLSQYLKEVWGIKQQVPRAC